MISLFAFTRPRCNDNSSAPLAKPDVLCGVPKKIMPTVERKMSRPWGSGCSLEKTSAYCNVSPCLLRFKESLAFSQTTPPMLWATNIIGRPI